MVASTIFVGSSNEARAITERIVEKLAEAGCVKRAAVV
jgi:hypothetical protein